jgi:transcriptional regulator with GAF, ATPase, and Fis domain
MAANESGFDPSGHEAVASLIEEFAELARQVHASDDFDDSMSRITATARHAIGGCDSASVSLLTKDGPITRGATDAIASAGDQIQYQTGEGPCLDAAMEERWIYTPNVGIDPRWPRSAAQIGAELGVGSMFSCRMTLDAAPNKTLGGLNLYAMTPEAFSSQDQLLAILLSSLGAVVLDSARQQEQLRAAIATRQVIGEAIGILRAQSNLNSEQAFQLLSRASQRTNVKLRDLAQQITEGSRTGRETVRPDEWAT